MRGFVPKSWPYCLGGLVVVLHCLLGAYLLLTAKSDSINLGDGRTSLTLAVPAGIMTSPIYREKIRKFEEQNPDISVRLMDISGGYYQKVLVMIAGNVAPDLMWMGQSFSEFGDRGVFLDISERIEASDIDLSRYNQKILNLYMREGKRFSIPFGIDTCFMVYNRKLFREAGLPYPSDDWTYPEFLRAAVALTKRDASGKAVCYGYRGSLPIEVFGASLFDPQTGAVSCNTPEMVSFFETNLDLVHNHRVSPTPEEAANQSHDVLTYFKQERTAMMIMTTMHWNRAFELLADMDWGMTLSPKFNQHGQWASSAAICIYRNTKHPDEAWRLFRCFQDRDFQLAMGSRVIPSRTDLIAEMPQMAKAVPANFKVVEKMNEVLYPTPRVPHLQELMAVYHRFAGKIFERQLSPAEGMAECEAEMKRRIEKFKVNEQ